MWEETERSPALAAPGSNNFAGLIASSTNASIGSKQGKVQGGQLSGKERDRLANELLPLVDEIARHYSGKGIDFEELQARGGLGLVNAINYADPAQIHLLEGYARK
jgi:DNA-directed RNA polymerase sigma subunit (sigma70/sigma32)